jgi:hypothetical protein
MVVNLTEVSMDEPTSDFAVIYGIDEVLSANNITTCKDVRLRSVLHGI